MSFPAVTVYTKPACVQCDHTKARLTRAGAPFTEVDVTADDTALDFITRDLGYTAAPVVYLDDDGEQRHWSGYRPDLIRQHITQQGGGETR
ncbi:glutaredoxin family protein [Kocuria rhizophila]|uniref:glutaredoxin family protein n=1 Tax=Kocuria rhizophila TaxID=72000 RepID=UPI0011A2F5BA|nr:glutaredoxin family protein [Kocuria rhizophila]MCG7425083.1 glutaredoxin family protein [Kocuria rhizophila]MCT2249401.1 glutaredoxin family protein [Kocuria rhizophila]